MRIRVVSLPHVTKFLYIETQKDLIRDVKLIIDDLAEAVNNAGPHSTSELESFHSSLNRNAPKMEGFSYSGMMSR